MTSDDALPWKLASPREAALRILVGRFGNPGRLETTVALADFQRDSAAAALEIVERRGGVLIADSVGLGKTFIALALIERAIARGQKALIVVPAALRRMWRTELLKLDRSAQLFCLISHTQLARSCPVLPGTGKLVVVDEAHAFRNPTTLRYRSLRRACRDSQVVLLTATPVNNSLADLYFQLRLFCSDGALQDLGIGSLRAALLASPLPADIARIKRALIVRRTRADARLALASAPLDARSRFRFPRGALTCSLPYCLPIPVPLLEQYLSALSFPAYRLASRTGHSGDLLRFGLLKRMESSVRAIQLTLGRQIRFYDRYTAALRDGMLLRPRDFRALYAGDESSMQLVFDVAALEPFVLPLTDRNLDEASREAATLRQWQDALRSSEDGKLNALTNLLLTRRPARTVVFTEFRDTARYLWSALRRRFRVALIDGAGAWIGEAPSSRRRAVECFAPRANSAHVHPREAVEVLVATDVLAEGMNLQDADAVVSYDLPWNPVRLIQRAGRVDRIGSDHDLVSVYNFLPDREFDAFLGLARTIRNKLETVRGVVGVERAVLEPEEDFETVVRALRTGQADLLTRLDGGAEARLRAELLAATPIDETTVPVARLGGEPACFMMLALQRGREFDVVALELTTGAETDAVQRLLLRAIELDMVCTFEAEPLIARALLHIEELNRRAETTQLGRVSVASRIARIVRQRLAELPLDDQGDAFARADALLEQLACVADSGLESELEDVLVGAHSVALPTLLGTLENVFSQRNSAARRPPRWHLVALVASD